jgi:hypothetical protein
MKVDKCYKLHRACANESTPYNLAGAVLDRHDETPWLVATDGRMLARIPVSNADTDDGDALIPADAIKHATGGKKSTLGEIVCNGTIRASRGPNDPVAEFAAEKDFRFPPWREVIPTLNAPLTDVVEFGINAHSLSALADAIGSSSGVVRIRLQVNRDGGDRLFLPNGERRPDVDAAMLVDSPQTRGEGALGIIMPASV